MKKTIQTLAFLALISCESYQQDQVKSSFFRSSEDSLHANNIERNMIPMYSVKGAVNRLSITEMMEKDNIPGLSIAFVDQGEISWQKCYGFSNLADSIPVNIETVFTGASLSKPITAVAALNLVEKGLLDLDEDVNKKLTEWKVPMTELTQKEKVTLRRLIGHQAGIKNDLWSSYLPGENVPTLNQMLSGEKPSVDPATSVVHEPGSKTEYSNPGYAIIQKLLMDVSNQEFDPIINNLVFEPSGMENSSFKQPIPEFLMERRAIGYTPELEPYPYKLFPYQAAGGIWTTPSDLAKFMITLMEDHRNGTNKLISRETSELIFSKNYWRFVFNLWNWGDDIVFKHYGSNQGFNCFMYGSINKNQGIVVMTNSDNAFGFFDYIQRAVNDEYQWEYVRPEILDPIEPDISWFGAFDGFYDWRGSSVQFILEDQNLFMHIDGENYDMTQVGERDFVLSEIPLKISFSKSEDGKITIREPDGYPFRTQLVEN